MSDRKWPTYEQWLNGLDGPTRERAEALTSKFERLDAPDPESWARSEVSENIAQLGRFGFLRAVWREVERWRDGPSEAARASFETAMGIVQLLDNEEDIAVSEPMPGW